jgi:predicted enzyme related to lactoylglutathione lyase
VATARFPGFVIDCPDPGALATFYGGLLDWQTKIEDDWAEIRPAHGGDCISFQRVEGYTPPQWPAQTVPQQIHLDLIVDDLDEGELSVAERGGTKAEFPPGTTFRVFLDPAGHPFCLCIS